MLIYSFLFQIFSGFIGIVLAQRVFEKYSTQLTFDNSYRYSKIFIFISIISLFSILLGGMALQFDSFCLKLPLLYQKYSMFILWITLVVYLSFVSGFLLYITLKVKRERFKSYSFALLFMNILLLINHYERNVYGGEDIKKEKGFSKWVKQSTNYSCSSASIATVARYFDLNISEKEVAEHSRLTKLGANSGQVRFALDALGISYHTLIGKDDLKQLKSPAILYVDNPVVGYEGHAIVYLGKNHYGYEIWNPVGFKIYLSKEELKEIWHGHGEECFSLK